MKHLLYILLIFVISFACQAQDTKNVRGQVIDKDSKFPIMGATITLVNSNPIIAVSTDMNGYFTLMNVPLGRVSIKATMIGYKESVASDVLIIAGKELQLSFELEERINEIEEVTIKADGNANQTAAKNEMISVSARSFDTELTNKFSGSRNDPARMATNFAGVSGANDARNDIIIRGNSPMGLLWRLEGVDIPSPNHFGSFGSTGGPVSMLNNNNLAKSDFMTAAFPSEYGNALAGVFDLKMRSGNKDKYEFMAQIGFNGVEVGAEGPFNRKKSNASFMFNYRYSTLALFKLIGANFGTGTAIPRYQDLSFKIDIPTKKAGVFKIFGIGGISAIELISSKVDTTKKKNDLFGNYTQDIYNKVQTGIAGISHTYFINSKSFTKVVIAVSHQNQKAIIDTISLTDITNVQRFNKVALRQNKYSFHGMYNIKANSKNTILSGVMVDVMDQLFSDSIKLFNAFIPLKYNKGYGVLTQVYTSWQHKFNDQLSLVTGVHLMHFSISNSIAPELRIGFKYQINAMQSISFGYGLHHQIQPLPTYYNNDISIGAIDRSPTNLDMKFSRSNHLVVGYDLVFKRNFHLRTEVYYQYLDKIPVESFASSFSMLNAGANFGTPNNINLVNKGEGRNYGIELTLEKFYSKGYYFLLTTSLFQSQYKGSDHKWRNTAFNGLYVVNGLAGYEYKFGGRKNKTKKYSVALDGKITIAGGRYYTPIDYAQSAIQRQEVLLDNQAFTKKYPYYLKPDLKFTFRMSMKKITHEFSFDAQNFINRRNYFRIAYNPRTNSESVQYQQGFFPLPQYRLLF
ncbi:MAG: TonB-dependent receptor [Bacteroidota bacterium]